MRRIVLVPLALFVGHGLLACSGADLVVAAGAPDAETDQAAHEASVPDSEEAGPDGSSDDAGAIDAAEAAIEDADADVDVDVGDATEETFDAADAALDGAVDAAPETCAKNACGTCGTLVTPPPKTPCGKCGTSAYVCTATGDATYCAKPEDGNACGGCAPLAAKIGAACGPCNGGKVECNGIDATKCADTFASPLPGTACGKCGGGTYQCAAAANATVCVDPVTNPAPGTACGVCGVAKWTCTADKKNTFCPATDDRTTFVDSDATAGGTYGEQARTGRDVGIPFKVVHGGELTIELHTLAKPYECIDTICPHPDPRCSKSCYSISGICGCDPGATTAGEVTFEVMSGASVGTGTSLATVKKALPLTGWQTIAFPASFAVTAGKSYWLRITTTGDTWQLPLSNAATGGLDAYVRDEVYAPGAGWGASAAKVAVKVKVKGCS